jgi:5-methylcytosine-specific restriction endonuclease McrA
MSNSWISTKARKWLYERDNLICCYCERKCIIGATYELKGSKREKCATLDHIVPQKELAAASTDDKHFRQLRRDPKNLVVVCCSCNASKQDTPLYVWCKQTGKHYERILAEVARRIAL